MYVEGREVAIYELQPEEFFDFIHKTVHELASAKYDLRLVCESFIITVHTAKNSQATWSIEMIGVLKFLAHRYKLEPVKLQAPAVGKTFGTNAKLRYLGWWRSGMIEGKRYAGHGNDAARHLATYAAQRGLIFSREELVALADV